MLGFSWNNRASNFKYIALASCISLVSACGGGGSKSSNAEGVPTSSVSSAPTLSASSTSTSTVSTSAISYSSLSSAPLSNLSVFAGNAGGVGNVDGVGSAARFFHPNGITLDSLGNLYVADSANATIRKVTQAGKVTTIAITYKSETLNEDIERYEFNLVGVVFDNAGNLLAVDSSLNVIFKINSKGEVIVVAGELRKKGSADGKGALARFDSPSALAIDVAGNLYVTDSANHTIRKVTPEGVVTTLAGLAGTLGSSDGQGSAARFSSPSGVAVDTAGNIYVSDMNNSIIRKISSNGTVTTLAGTAGTFGLVDATGAAARFSIPDGLAVDNAGTVYVADEGNHVIRKITAAGEVSSLAGLKGQSGSADGIGQNARFNTPVAVAVDNAGNVYVAEWGSIIRKITPQGAVTTLAGLALVQGSEDGLKSAATFKNPAGIAADSAGNFYVVDSGNAIIRKITPQGMVTTFAGSATSARNIVDGTGAAASFSNPTGIVIDATGNIYITDDHTIRKITQAAVVTTFVGAKGISGSVDGTGVNARFGKINGLAVDAAGNLLVADSDNQIIRKITSAGVVTTIAGVATEKGFADGPIASARFYYPESIAVDASGNIFITDPGNVNIRKIDTKQQVTTIAGMDRHIGSSDGSGKDARFSDPRGIVVDSSGNLYVADRDNLTIRKITPAGIVSTVIGNAQTYGFSAGNLPGSLHQPEYLTLSGDSLYITMGGGVIRAMLPK